MERVRTVSGSGPVYVDSASVGHCAFEINIYKDSNGRMTGHGHVMGDSAILSKMSAGQLVEIAEGDEGQRFQVSTGEWSPGARRMDVETIADIVH